MILTVKVLRESLRLKLKKMELDKSKENNPGDDFFTKWVDKHAEEFSKKWEISKCKTCLKCEKCGFKQKNECDFYTEDKEK